MLGFRLPELNDSEKITLRLHLFYQVMQGVILGVLALNEFVFIKSLQGTNYQLGFLFQFSMIVFTFLIIFNELRKRIRNKRRMLRVTGLVTRLPLLLIFLFPSTHAEIAANPVYHYIFLAIFLFYYFGNILIFPAINVLLKTNYRHENFGKLYSYATSVNKIVTMVTILIYGLLLDADNFAFTYVIPLAGIMGISSIFALSNIDYSKVIQTPRAASLKASISQSVGRMVGILRTNKPYLHFEIGFMFYGFSFMITVVIINIFFEDGLGLNYTSVAFYKNAYNILAIILLPFAGKLLGNIDPRKFASITFGSLFLYTLFLLLTDLFPWSVTGWNITFYPMLMVAFTVYGVFAATMVLLWNIGSAYFCKPEEADDYQSVHLFLTGVRAIVAPIFGVFFYEQMGFRGTFILAMASLAFSVWLMKWSYDRDRIKARRSIPEAPAQKTL